MEAKDHLFFYIIGIILCVFASIGAGIIYTAARSLMRTMSIRKRILHRIFDQGLMSESDLLIELETIEDQTTMRDPYDIIRDLIRRNAIKLTTFPTYTDTHGVIIASAQYSITEYGHKLLGHP